MLLLSITYLSSLFLELHNTRIHTTTQQRFHISRIIFFVYKINFMYYRVIKGDSILNIKQYTASKIKEYHQLHGFTPNELDEKINLKRESN